MSRPESLRCSQRAVRSVSGLLEASLTPATADLKAASSH
jgi:hypothetical protein